MAIPEGLTYQQLAQIPGMPPPPGHTSNFDNPEVDGSLRTTVFTVGGVFAGLTLLFCLLRLYARLRITKNAGWDDVVLVVALVCAFAYTGLIFAANALILDVHMWNISVLSLVEYLPMLRALGYIYFLPTLVMSKLTLCSLFLRLFGPKRELKIAVWCATAWAVIVSLVAFFWSLGLCSAIGIEYTLCSNETYVPYLAAAGMNVSSDVTLLIIPLWGVFSLQMHRKRKIALSLIFLTGILAVIASCLGLYYRNVQRTTPDLTWTFGPVNILSMVEIDTTIIVACLPSLPSLFKGDVGVIAAIKSSGATVKGAFAARRHSLQLAGFLSRTDSNRTSEPNTPCDEPDKIIVKVRSEIFQMEEGMVDADRRARYAPFDKF